MMRKGVPERNTIPGLSLIPSSEAGNADDCWIWSASRVGVSVKALTAARPNSRDLGGERL